MDNQKEVQTTTKSRKRKSAHFSVDRDQSTASPTPPDPVDSVTLDDGTEVSDVQDNLDTSSEQEGKMATNEPSKPKQCMAEE